MKRPNTTAFALGALLTLTGVCTTAGAGYNGHGRNYDVTITNLTHGVSFTPFLVASHRAAPDLLFTPGDAPSDELVALAEIGNTGPLSDVVDDDPRVLAVQGTAGLLEPGQSVTVTVKAIPGWGHISLAAMLLPTNDGMVALQNMRIPVGNQRSTAWAYGYDAGSELNDEVCNHIPGPHCAGDGVVDLPDVEGEGYIHIHPGIHGVADLMPADYDWRNPVARVTIMRSH